MQQKSQEHRHRVVEPGFDFEQGKQPLWQSSAGPAQQHGDRRGIGRRGGGAGEQRSEQRDAVDQRNE